MHQSFPEAKVPTNVSVSEFPLRHNPDDVAVDKVIFCDVDHPCHSVTYGGIRRLASQAAAGLRSVCGMEEGDAVFILAENSTNWAVLAHAIIWGGGYFRYTPYGP